LYAQPFCRPPSQSCSKGPNSCLTIFDFQETFIKLFYITSSMLKLTEGRKIDPAGLALRRFIEEFSNAEAIFL